MLKTVIDFWHKYLLDYTYALGIISGFYILSRLLPWYMAKLAQGWSERSKFDYSKPARSFVKPIAVLLLITGFYLAAIYLLGDTAYGPFFTRVFRSLVIILIAQGLLNLVGDASGLLMGLGSRYDLDRLFTSLLTKSLRAVICTISFVILIQEWGYDITGFIAGLGLGGLAFALAAQDTAANLIGGVVILTEKPFTIGDWIVTGDKVEGIVEDITFRSTRIRTFARAVVTVPNSSLAKTPITNWTRMGRREILFRLKVARETPGEKLKASIGSIRQMLLDCPYLHPGVILVNLESIAESSLDIYTRCFTETTVFAEWLQIREDILLGALAILKKEGVALAVPAKRVYGADYKSGE